MICIQSSPCYYLDLGVIYVVRCNMQLELWVIIFTFYVTVNYEKYSVVKFSPVGLRSGVSACAQRFSIHIFFECNNFKKNYLVYMVGFECPHHFMVSSPLNLHSLTSH